MHLVGQVAAWGLAQIMWLLTITCYQKMDCPAAWPLYETEGGFGQSNFLGLIQRSMTRHQVTVVCTWQARKMCHVADWHLEIGLLAYHAM